MKPGSTRSMASRSRPLISTIRHRPVNGTTDFGTRLAMRRQRSHLEGSARSTPLEENRRTASTSRPEAARGLLRDPYVRRDTNDYAAHLSAVGRRVQVIAGREQVVGSCVGSRRRRAGRVMDCR
ncbi:MAG: Mu transposase domain-containing protein [Actinophytocola sp.]|uniref:Mu transposase domain-containing protein n=1 Tax=Actinophytocola sp. TaxID=1872138 RepID=UPI003D6AA144